MKAWPVVVALLCWPACTRSGFVDWPCRGVTCSGHGRCGVTHEEQPACMCDPGYRAVAELRCLAEPGPLPEAGIVIDGGMADGAATPDSGTSDGGVADGAALDGGAGDGQGIDDATPGDGPAATDSTLVTPPTLSFAVPALDLDEASGRRGAPWPEALAAWSHRLTLELATGDNPEPLLDFPLLVTLDAARLPPELVAADGRDLRFVDPDGTALDFDVDIWDPGGASRVWVRVPSLDAAPGPDAIYLYVGNPAATAAASSAAVWSSSYALVYHLDEAGGGVDAVRDSTANDHRASTVAGVEFGEPSPLGLGITVPNDSSGNSSAYLAVSSTASHLPPAGGSFTFTALARVEDMVDGVIFSAFEQSASGRDLELGILRRSPFMRYFGDDLTAPAAVIEASTWHDLAFVYDADADQSRIFVDGEIVAQSSAGPYAGTASTLRVGYRGGSTGYYFKGALDEVRLATAARSAAWLRAEALARRDLLIRYGEPEPRLSVAPPAAQLGVVLSRPLPDPITVGVTAAGSATPGVDVVLSSSTVTIPAGLTRADIELSAVRDGVGEGDEHLVLALVVPLPLQAGAHASCTVSIADEGGAAPQAVDDGIALTTYAPSALPVLDNDLGVAAVVWRIVEVTAPLHGAIDNLGRHLVYRPDEDHPGTDTFDYTISDGREVHTATVVLTMVTPHTWIGGGADSRWNTAANWAGGAVPTATSAVYFNALCGSTCAAVIDAAAQADGVRLASAFAGTLTQSGAATLTVGTGGYRQRGGSFVGGSGTITVRRFELLGGSFASTSGTLSVLQEGYRARVDSDFLLRGGSFTAGSGRVAIWGANAYSRQYRAHVDVGATPLNDLTLSGQGVYFELAGTTRVQGTLTLNAQSCGGCNVETLSGGVLEAHGDIVNDSHNTGFAGTSTRIRLVGEGARTLRGPATPNSGSCVPVIEIDTPADVVIQGYHYLRGGLLVAQAGNVTTTDSILRFCGSATIQSGGVIFDDVQLDCSNTVYTLIDPLRVAGTLTLSDGATGGQVNGGAILALGDVALVGRSKLGSTPITLGGSAPASLSIATTVVDRVPGPVLTIDKPAGVVVSLSGAPLDLGQPGQGLALLGGTLALNGLGLVVDGEFQFPAGAVVALDGASLSYGSITPPLGSGGTLMP
jgi:hypothetical protein